MGQDFLFYPQEKEGGGVMSHKKSLYTIYVHRWRSCCPVNPE